MEDEFSLVEMLDLLKKRIGLIINTFLVGVVLAAGFTFFVATPTYSATTQLLVNRTQDTETLQRAEIDSNIQLINTYFDIIRNPIILNPVKEELNLSSSPSEISNQITVSTENNSQVFSVQVLNSNPYTAAKIANTTANVFQDSLDTIMNVDNVSIISEANPNLNPVSPNNIFNLIIGALIGLITGVIIVLAMEFLDTTVKDEKFITNQLGWNNLGHVSKMSADELEFNSSQNSNQISNDSRTSRSRIKEG